MPEPKLGETWEIRDLQGRTTRGFIAGVLSNRVTLVSLIGARTYIPRPGFDQGWTKTADPPVTNLHCVRCADPGIFTYQRGVSPEFACPRHLPIGVLATLHKSGIPAPQSEPKSSTWCSSCGNVDPIEDARMGQLERHELRWWTCTLCSCRWGIIQKPSKTDSVGRWYADILSEILDTMVDSSDLRSITCSSYAWETLREAKIVADVDRTAFRGVVISKNPTLDDGVIFVHAKNAPPGATTVSRPIRKVGGVGDRSIREPVATSALPINFSALTGPERRIPEAGKTFYQKSTGNAFVLVQVDQNDRNVSIAIQPISDSLVGTPPTIFRLEDFYAEFSPDPYTATVQNTGVLPKQEWFSFVHDEYVTIRAVDPSRMLAIVYGSASGRTRNEHLDDFTDPLKFKLTVRKSAFERLLEDEEDTKS